MAKNEKSGGNTSDVKVDNVRTESFWYKIAKSGKNESVVTSIPKKKTRKLPQLYSSWNPENQEGVGANC